MRMPRSLSITSLSVFVIRCFQYPATRPPGGALNPSFRFSEFAIRVEVASGNCRVEIWRGSPPWRITPPKIIGKGRDRTRKLRRAQSSSC